MARNFAILIDRDGNASLREDVHADSVVIPGPPVPGLWSMVFADRLFRPEADLCLLTDGEVQKLRDGYSLGEAGPTYFVRILKER